MASATVRYWRGGWVADVSTAENGKWRRSIKAFGAGSKARAAAEAYRDEIAPQATAGKFWERQTATFCDPLLGTVFRYGKLIGLMRDNPAADVKKPRAMRKAVYTLEADEIARLRAALTVPSERLLVELAITTGRGDGTMTRRSQRMRCARCRSRSTRTRCAGSTTTRPTKWPSWQGSQSQKTFGKQSAL
jgi:hypothetical protein